MVDAEKKNPELEQNKKDGEMSLIGKVVVIGLFGGVFWSLLSYFTYVFNFTELSPNLILKPWILGDWKNRVLGQFIGIFVIGIISIGVALLYYALLKKFQSIWVGAGFGIALWLLVFYVFNPIFPDIKTVAELERNTVITTLCFYILYGVFIGYSISFEENEMKGQRRVVSANE
ncbi:YqhR family membrane protein [Bacillus sinesaloumensis]|uniref:YqhR family membrane protein n=1 Tax=Litchfieldia sinesaloumensis TaxID=1926280 RepID=UPI001F2472E7|nr:YqhR family membrane protein [Bacillus sinesaloumensis]